MRKLFDKNRKICGALLVTRGPGGKVVKRRFCKKKATTLYYASYSEKVDKRCEEHAQKNVKAGGPEMVDKCANCGCLNPIN